LFPAPFVAHDERTGGARGDHWTISACVTALGCVSFNKGVFIMRLSSLCSINRSGCVRLDSSLESRNSSLAQDLETAVPAERNARGSLGTVNEASSSGTSAGPAAKYWSAKIFGAIQRDFYQACKNVLTKTGKSPAQIDSFMNDLESISHMAGFSNFKKFIRNLWHSDLKDTITPKQIVKILEEVVRSPEIRHLVFAVTSGVYGNCESRTSLSLVLENVRYLTQASLWLREAATPEEVQGKMFHLCLGLFRINLLDEVTPQVMQQQCQEKRLAGDIKKDWSKTREALRVQLGLRVSLAERLSLPFRANGMKLVFMPAVNGRDLYLAINYVEQRTDNEDATAAGLACQPLWRNYLDKCYPQEVMKIKESSESILHELAGQAAEEAPGMGMGSQYCAEQINEISTVREKELTQFYKEKTKQIIEQGARPGELEILI